MNKIFFLLLIIAVLFIGGCVGEVWDMSIESQRKLECEDFAKELIPDNFTLMGDWKLNTNETTSTIYSEKLFGTGELINDSRWKDGTPIKTYGYFVPGSTKGPEGDRSDYHYFVPALIVINGTRGESPTYSKNVISSDGREIGTRVFKIKPVLKAIEGTENVIYTGPSENPTMYKAKTMQFEVVDVEFVSCRWVTDDGVVIE